MPPIRRRKSDKPHVAIAFQNLDTSQHCLDARFLYTERLIAAGYARREIEHHLVQRFAISLEAAQQEVRGATMSLRDADGVYDIGLRRAYLRAILDNLLAQACQDRDIVAAVRVAKLIARIDGIEAPTKVELGGQVGIDFSAIHEAIARRSKRLHP